MQTILPLSFRLDKRHAERVWANCSRKFFSVGFIGVGFLRGGWFFGVGFLPLNAPFLNGLFLRGFSRGKTAH